MFKNILSSQIFKYILWSLAGFVVTLLCGVIIWGIYTNSKQNKDTIKTNANSPVNNKEIQVDLLNSDVEIYGIDGVNINVEFEGSESETKKIKTSESAKKFKISNRQLFGINLFTNKLTTEHNKVKIEVPQNLKLNIKTSDSSRVSVIGYKGMLNLNMTGAGKFECVNCEFKDAEIFQNGPATAEITKLTEYSEIKIVGPGMVRIVEAELQNAKLSVNGSGGIYIDKGTLENAEATIDGSGIIRIPKVNKNFEQSIKGAGEVIFSDGN